MSSPDTPEVAEGPGQDPVAASPGAATPVRPARRVVLLASLALVVVALDIATKQLALSHLTPGVSPRALGGLIYFSLYRNSGAAFNIATGQTWVLAVIAIAVVAAIIKIAPRLRSAAWAVCLGLILGGAFGNLLDRIFRAPGFLRGEVVDFVSLFGPNAKYFAVFNFADSAISVGGVALVIIALLGIDFDGHRTSRRAAKAKGG